MDILDNVLIHFFGGGFVFFLGIVFGWWLREQRAIRVIENMFNQAEALRKEEEAKATVMCRLEIHDGHFYMYGVEDNTFYGQGSNKEELSEALRKRFPEKVFLIKKDELSTLENGHEHI